MSQDVYNPSPWQRTYHGLKHDEALGAGAAGPGKTLTLLMDPLAQIVCEHERATNAKHPHTIAPGTSVGWALSLRRTMPMIEQTIVRSHRIFPRLDPGARFDAQKHTWVFSSGYRYQFGHCKDPNDWEMYFSNEYSWVGFDELVQFTEEQYDQISGRVRSSDPILRGMLKTRAMSNPTLTREMMDNVSVQDPMWVRKRFVDPAREGKVTLVKNLTLASGEKVRRTRIYLPATLYDNPDPEFVRGYEATLRDKKPHIQQALLYGNWYASVGSFFGEDWVQAIHVCKPFKVPDDWLRFRSMDWGFKAPGCIHWWAMDYDGNLYCERELTFRQMTATDVAKRAKEIEQDLDLWGADGSRITGVADTQLWEKRGSSARTMADEFQAVGVGWVRADKTSRSRNAGFLLSRLKDHEKRTATPGVVFFESCKMAIQTIPTILATKDDPETPQDGGDDHWADSCYYACNFASFGRSGIPAKKSKHKNYDAEERDGARGSSGYGNLY